MKEVESKVFVNKMFKTRGRLISSEDKQEVISVHRIPEDAAYVTVSTDKKRSVNLGNFNNVSASVFISVPCPMDPEQQDLAFEYVDNFTTEKLESVLGDHLPEQGDE